MRLSIIPFAFLVIPMAEIAVFILVGSQIGVLATLGMIVVTAIAGTTLLRIQGFGIVTRIRKTLDEGGIPDRDLIHGVMILLAGVLLLTPGFVTDTMGFLLFIPAIRDAGWRFLRSRIVVASGFSARPGGPGGFRPRDSRTIDLDAGEYEAPDDRPRAPDRDRLE